MRRKHNNTYEIPPHIKDPQRLRLDALNRRLALNRASCDTYIIGVRDNAPAIQCLCCGLGSSSRKDIKQKYCGFCKEFHQAKPKQKRHGKSTKSRYDDPKTINYQLIEIDHFEIGAWSPDQHGKMPPEQVHLTTRIKTLEDFGFVIRLKTHHAVTLFVDELTHYRDIVFPHGDN